MLRTFVGLEGLCRVNQWDYDLPISAFQHDLDDIGTLDVDVVRLAVILLAP